MPLTGTLKHLTLRLLPESILRPLRKVHYGRKVLQAADEPEMAVIPHLLPFGGCALDLGANFGMYTRFFAETVGPDGQVHAVEPVPETYDVLQSNVEHLGLANVTVHNVAVSGDEGTVTMVVPEYARGGENLYEARVINQPGLTNGRVVQVPACRLDDLCGRLGQIDFVKCDVEGHELSVVRGADEILRIHRPAWLIEVSGDPDDPESSAAELVEHMRQAGYRMYHLDFGTPRPRATGDRAANYFFLRPEHVRWLKCGIWL
jgi:FkbM family methyltransferase